MGPENADKLRHLPLLPGPLQLVPEALDVLVVVVGGVHGVEELLDLGQGVILFGQSLPLLIVPGLAHPGIDVFDLLVELQFLAEGFVVVGGNLGRDDHLVDELLPDGVVDEGESLEHLQCIIFYLDHKKGQVN